MSTPQKRLEFIKELKNKLLQRTYGNVPEETVLLKAFKYFDLDNSGQCSKKEFLHTILKIGVTSFSEQEILSIFDYFDVDNSGQLDYKEFTSVILSKDPFGKKQTDEQKLQEPIQQNVQENYQENLSKKKEVDNFEEVLNIIRQNLAAKGVQGICGISRNFRIVDDNNSQTVNFEEFKKVCKDFRSLLSEKQIKIVFDYFDKENSGEIDYDEFIRTVRGEMNNFRQQLVQQAFNNLDENKKGKISFEEIQNKYNAKLHPDVLSGKKSEKDQLNEFMNTFQDTYNYLCGTESDNVITIEEFNEYYENVSMCIDDDAYFELLMNNCWKMNLNPKYNELSWQNVEQNKLNENLQKQKQQEIEKENQENALKKFRKEILKKNIDTLFQLEKQFKLLDDTGKKEIDYYSFNKILTEFGIILTDEDVSYLFDYFSENDPNYLNYGILLDEIRPPLNEKRTEIIKEAFAKLDIEKGGIVDINEIKLQYNAKNNPDLRSGRKTEEEIFSEFINTFQLNHDNKVGFRNKRVSFNEFLDYYKTISMYEPDDDYFIENLQNSWKINPSYSKLTSPEKKNEEEVSYAYGDLRKKKVVTGAAAAPFGTDVQVEIKPEKKYFYPEPEVKKEKEISPVEVFRNVIKKRGSRGILAMRRAFMIADEDDSKSLTLMEFIKFCKDYRIGINGKQIRDVFNEFDFNKNGTINYQEFCKGVMGEMNDRRKNLVKIIFETFDKNKSGYIDLDDIRDVYSAKNHPDVISGKKTEDEVLAEFLDTFQYHFSLLNDNKTKDNKITLEEFMEYYNNISVGIEDDDYFEEVLKNAYDLDNRRVRKKGWKNIL